MLHLIKICETGSITTLLQLCYICSSFTQHHSLFGTNFAILLLQLYTFPSSHQKIFHFSDLMEPVLVAAFLLKRGHDTRIWKQIFQVLMKIINHSNDRYPGPSAKCISAYKSQQLVIHHFLISVHLSHYFPHSHSSIVSLCCNCIKYFLNYSEFMYFATNSKLPGSSGLGRSINFSFSSQT